MRISDWSSDVCSSDLPVFREISNARHTSLMLSPSRRRATKRRRSSITELSFHGINTSGLQLQAEVLPMCPVQNVTYLSGRSLYPRLRSPRPEERRVGKASVSSCRYRGSPYHYKQKQNRRNLESIT